MASVHDVAAYLVQRCGPMSTMKLQKLVYYCQAWHLVWDEEPMFPERIEAWANGPVVYELFNKHRGEFSVESWPYGDPANLTQTQRATADVVVDDYAALSGRQLSYLTHTEGPWRTARGDLPATAWSRNEITPESLQDYYTAVAVAEDAKPVEDIDWASWDEQAA